MTWCNRFLMRWSFLIKHCEQVSHWYGFSPVCILVCRKSSAGLTNRLSQTAHWCLAFGLMAFIRTGGIKCSVVGVSGMKNPPSSSLCWITSVMSFSLSDSRPLSLFGDSGWIWTTSLPFESRIVGSSLFRVCQKFCKKKRHFWSQKLRRTQSLAVCDATGWIVRATMGVCGCLRIEIGFAESVEESKTTKLLDFFDVLWQVPSSLGRFACDCAVAEVCFAFWLKVHSSHDKCAKVYGTKGSYVSTINRHNHLRFWSGNLKWEPPVPSWPESWSLFR